MRIDETLLADATKLFVSNFPPLDKAKDNVFTRGVQLCRDKVAIITSYNGNHLFGVVHDGDDLFDVNLHLLHPEENSCTCNLLANCEHTVSLFATFYTEKHPLKKLLQDRLHHTLLASNKVSRASDIVTKKNIVNKKLEDTTNWWQYFKNEFFYFKEERKRSFLYSDYLLLNDIAEMFYPRLLKEHEANHWYKIYATFFCFHEFMLQLENHHVLNSFQESNILPLANRLLDNFYEYYHEAAATEEPCPFLDEMNEKVSALLLMISRYRYPVFSLFFIWTHNSLSKSDYANYLKKYKSINGDSAHMLRGALYFHLERDEKAILEWNAIQPVDALELYYFIVDFFIARAEQAERCAWYMSHYRKLLITSLQSNDSNNQRTLLVQDYMKHYFATEEDENAREQEIIFFMPYSFQTLSDRFINQGKYNDWAELHLLLDYGLEELPKTYIQMTEEQFPEAMLPFYFKEVDLLVAKKNRQSYREAVRMLKKLKKLYRAMKELPTFERYIEQLSSNTKRMKAFQEELAKGRLI